MCTRQTFRTNIYITTKNRRAHSSLHIAQVLVLQGNGDQIQISLYT